MAKVSPRRIGKERQEYWEHLLRRTFTEVPRKNLSTFFCDLLTASERVMLARRIQIAKYLMRGLTHDEIRDELHVGQDTIEAVDRWLRATFEEYRAILIPIYRQFREECARKGPPPDRYSFERLRKKYPWHYLFFNLALGDMETLNIDTPPEAFRT